jgi:hypothetical protein
MPGIATNRIERTKNPQLLCVIGDYIIYSSLSRPENGSRRGITLL